MREIDRDLRKCSRHALTGRIVRRRTGRRRVSYRIAGGRFDQELSEILGRKKSALTGETLPLASQCCLMAGLY
jgi:hypothetical protein